jgi:hypothetical protein
MEALKLKAKVLTPKIKVIGFGIKPFHLRSDDVVQPRYSGLFDHSWLSHSGTLIGASAYTPLPYLGDEGDTGRLT